MYYVVAALLQLVEQARQSQRGRRVNVVQQKDAAAVGIEPFYSTLHDL